MMSEMRKFVFVFTGPAIDKGGVPCEDNMSALTKLAEIFGWQTTESHCVLLGASVRVGDAVLVRLTGKSRRSVRSDT